MFGKAIVILVLATACCRSENGEETDRSKNIAVDFALFKARVHMLLSKFEPIAVPAFTIKSDPDDELKYTFSLKETSLVKVRTITRADEVVQDSDIVRIPVTFEPLGVKGSYSLSEGESDDVSSGNLTARIYNVQATLIVKYQGWISFSLSDLTGILVTHRGKADTYVNPTSATIELIRPDVEKRLKRVVARTIVKSLTAYFKGNKAESN